MIVSKTDRIPTKKIISVLGNISIKKTAWVSNNEEKAMEKLIKKAELMSANAIINYSYRGSGAWGAYESCSGLAVIVQDTQPDQNMVYCHNCGKLIIHTDRYCKHCGSLTPYGVNLTEKKRN